MWDSVLDSKDIWMSRFYVAVQALISQPDLVAVEVG